MEPEDFVCLSVSSQNSCRSDVVVDPDPSVKIWTSCVASWACFTRTRVNPYICCIRIFLFWGVYIRRVFGPKISENALGPRYFGALYPQCRYNIVTRGLGSVSVVWWPGSHHLSASLIQHCTAREISALLIQHRSACASGFV